MGACRVRSHMRPRKGVHDYFKTTHHPFNCPKTALPCPPDGKKVAGDLKQGVEKIVWRTNVSRACSGREHGSCRISSRGLDGWRWRQEQA